MDITNQNELYEAEKKLTDRERIALGGYMLLSGVIAGADILAYNASREIDRKAKPTLLQRRATEWLESDPCRAFIILYRSKALAQGGESVPQAEKSETETMLEDLDCLYNESTAVDDKIKIIKAKSDIRYRHKSDLQNEVSSVRFYLPQRCNATECPLYAQALAKMKLETDNKKNYGK